MGASVDIPASEVIPRQSYFVLEGLLQELRLRVMWLAAQIAAQQSSQRPPVITREHVHLALKRIAEEGLRSTSPGDHIGSFGHDPYMFLERRLHNLRMLIIRWAGKFARKSAHAEDESPVLIEPDHIRAAWEKVGSSPADLFSALVSDRGNAD